MSDMSPHLKPIVTKTGGPLKLTKVSASHKCPAPRVIVEVSGGCVVGVYSSDTRTKVSVLDWDNAKNDGDNGADAVDALKAESKILKQIL